MVDAELSALGFADGGANRLVRDNRLYHRDADFPTGVMLGAVDVSECLPIEEATLAFPGDGGAIAPPPQAGWRPDPEPSADGKVRWLCPSAPHDRIVRMVEPDGTSLLLLQRRGDIHGFDISDQLPFGDWRHGRWGWVFGSTQLLASRREVSGRQGIWYHKDQPVLTLWQPWASACFLRDPRTGYPLKRIETRSWRTPKTLRAIT